VWTLPEPGVTQDEAIAYGSGELPNFHAYQLRDVISAVRDKRAPAVSGVDGRRVVAIIQGVYESGRTGRPVRLSD
jgi:predicted dehydrogenase